MDIDKESDLNEHNQDAKTSNNQKNTANNKNQINIANSNQVPIYASVNRFQGRSNSVRISNKFANPGSVNDVNQLNINNDAKNNFGSLSNIDIYNPPYGVVNSNNNNNYNNGSVRSHDSSVLARNLYNNNNSSNNNSSSNNNNNNDNSSSNAIPFKGRPFASITPRGKSYFRSRTSLTADLDQEERGGIGGGGGCGGGGRGGWDYAEPIEWPSNGDVRETVIVGKY